MGVAYADYDQDGFVDFVVGNFNLGYTLYRNAVQVGADNNWLTVRLEVNPPVNRDAIGARVLVTTYDGLTQMQEVKSGSSLGAGDDTALHFGLGGSVSKKSAWSGLTVKPKPFTVCPKTRFGSWSTKRPRRATESYADTQDQPPPHPSRAQCQHLRSVLRTLPSPNLRRHLSARLSPRGRARLSRGCA